MRTRSLVAAGSLALVASLSACGGDGDGDGSAAPENASQDDFCEAFNGLYEKVLSTATDADSSSMVAALKEWVDDIEDVGTPSDMPDAARHGFEVFVDAAQDIDDGADLADLDNLGDDFSDDDEKDSEAFGAWTTENCPLDLPALPDASDLPSELPSELIDLPSELPTDPSELESMLDELTASGGG